MTYNEIIEANAQKAYAVWKEETLTDLRPRTWGQCHEAEKDVWRKVASTLFSVRHQRPNNQRPGS